MASNTNRDRPPQIVSKAEFARLIGVSGARVSQMIAEGKIEGLALVGEGRGARIRVNEAKRQIAAKSDIGQLLGNGLNTQLDFDADDVDGEEARSPASPALGARDPMNDQIKAEKLKALRLANERDSERRMCEQGTPMRSEDASRAMGKVASDLMVVFEGSLADFASAISGRYGVPARDVLVDLRAEFRKVRALQAVKAREEAAQLPETIEWAIPDIHGAPAGEG